MTITKRLKDLEDKINRFESDSRLFVCFVKDNKRVNRDGSEFELPVNYDKYKDTVVSIHWSLRQ